MPVPQDRCRGDQGRGAELPVGHGDAGDGGPRGRAVPAGRRLLGSAAASGRDLLIFVIVVVVATFTLHLRGILFFRS